MRQFYRTITLVFLLASFQYGICYSDQLKVKNSYREHIDFINSEIEINIPESRNHLIRYHNNTVNHLWYGSNKWAVKFDIPSYSAFADSFSLEEIQVFFPQYDFSRPQESSAMIEIFLDEQQPLTSPVFSYVIDVDQGNWNFIELPETETIVSEVFWVVIEYETNNTSEFMAGSTGSGQNSYYWVPPTPDGNIPGHFANMAENSAASEFLVSLSGHLFIDGIDLVLQEFWFEGTLEPETEIYPVLKIQNNSDIFVSEVSVRIRLQNQPNDFPEERITNLDINLESQDYGIFELDFEEFRFTLPAEFSQFSGRAILEHPEEGFPINNTITYIFNNFNRVFDKVLLENFIVTGHPPSLSIQSDQEAHNFDHENSIINYFFDHNDPFYHHSSLLRREFYSVSGYPFTIINGRGKIAGYFSDYADSLAYYIESNTDYNTFIEIRDIQAVHDLNEHSLQLEFRLENEDSHVLNSYQNDLRFHYFILEENIPGLNGGAVIDYGFIDGSLSLNFSQSEAIQINTQLQALTTFHHSIDDFDNFKYLILVQHRNNKKLYLLHWLSFSEFSEGSSSDGYYETPPSCKVSVFPNPLRAGRSLNIGIELKRNLRADVVEADIFNVKGQKVHMISKKINSRESAIVIDQDQLQRIMGVSGIYFINIRLLYKNELSHQQTRKLMIIK